MHEKAFATLWVGKLPAGGRRTTKPLFSGGQTQAEASLLSTILILGGSSNSAFSCIRHNDFKAPHLPVRLQIRSLEEFGILRISDLFSLRPFSCHFHSCGLQSFFWKTKNLITTTPKMKKRQKQRVSASAEINIERAGAKNQCRIML